MPKSSFILYLFFLPWSVSSQTADFSFESSSPILCNPSTIKFTQISTGTPICFVWDFGNNTKGYEEELTVIYNTPGNYTVKLIAIYEDKTIEISKSVVINPAVLTTIDVDKDFICNPGTINLSAVTNGNIAGYTWDFGDSLGLVNTVSKDTVRNYANYGDYLVSVTAADITGCIGTASKLIKVMKLPMRSIITPTQGCIPARAILTNVVTVPQNDFVTSYNWDFGDGSPVTATTGNNVGHDYTAVGVYYPKVNVVTNEGCTNSYTYPPIAFGTPPVNEIAYARKTIVCGSDSAYFVAKATDANRYGWNFGDGNFLIFADTTAAHKYATLGTKTILVVPYYNGCPGIERSLDIEVVGVIAKFNYANSCINKKAFSFANNSLGNVSSYVWNFGDGSPEESTRNVTHTFPDTGQYVTSLTVTDAVTGCSDTYFETIYTAEPVLVNPDSSICRNSSTSFSILNNYTDSLATFSWNVGGKIIDSSAEQSIMIVADSLGIFNNFVVIKYGSQTCPDTVRLNYPLLVRGPDLKFDAPSPICLNTTTTLTNTSKPFNAEDSITLMYWNYGNSTSNDTIYQPLPFQYARAREYRVLLSATDITGCQDSLVQFVKVNSNPFLKVIPHSDTLCLGQADTLVVFASSNILWSPSNNLSCFDCDTVRAAPSSTTQYFVTATTEFNCSVRDSVLIKVFAPFTASAPATDLYICLNAQAKLDVNPKDKIIIWTPATGLSNPAIFNPTAAPPATTTYTANLADSVGCFTSSIDINVFIKSLPTVNAGPDKIVPYNSVYTITPTYSNNITQYSWTPSTLLSCNDCPTPTGTSFNSETYTIKVTSDSGCVAFDNITIFVECKNANLFMPSAFTPNNDNLNDTYYPITRGFKAIVRFAIYNRQGKLIYEARNFPPNSKSFGWDGNFKGESQAAGGYVYILEAFCEMGEKLSKKGSFLLLR
ncbi:MAG: PKD domain-containing protein [Ferruginibacter sp.]